MPSILCFFLIFTIFMGELGLGKVEFSKTSDNELVNADNEADERLRTSLLLADSGYLEYSYVQKRIIFTHNLPVVFASVSTSEPTVDELISLIDPSYVASLRRAIDEYHQQGARGVFQTSFRTLGTAGTVSVIRVKVAVEHTADGKPALARAVLQNISNYGALDHSLKLLIDNSLDVIALFDSSLGVVNFNTSFATLIKALAGAEIIPGWQIQTDAKGGLSALLSAMSQTLSGRHIRRELHFDFSSGGSSDYEVFISPVKQGNVVSYVSLFGRDISHRMETERQMNEYLTFLETLLETVPMPVFYKDINGKYIGCNSVFEKYTGYTKSQLVGKSVYELYPVEMADLYHQRDAELFAAGGTQKYEGRMLFEDGTVKEVIYHKATFNDSDGNIAGLIGAIYDVTEKNMVERSLREINQTKDKLISIIAHDLKNPFSQVIGFAEVLLENLYVTDLASVERNLGYIRSAALSAYDLLLNLLDWSRIETGRVTFYPRQTNLRALISEVIESQRVFAEQKNITIFSNVLCDIVINADENMVKSVLRNLIGNAIKFTPEKGTVFANCVTEGEWVRVKIKDTGRGMDEATRTNILDGQMTSSAPGTANETGTGLGLHICRDFIELHKGTLQILSTPGNGTEISFTLSLNLSKPVGSK